MFLLDDLLTAPGKAVFFVFQELARKAQEELLDDESVKRQLQEIYNLLNSGQISDAEFEGRENLLLERLEQIAQLKLQSKPGADAIGNTATTHEPAAEAVRGADAFETLRSLCNLVSPVNSEATTDERITDSRQRKGADQISDNEPRKPPPSVSQPAAVADHVQPARVPIPGTVPESFSSSPRPVQPPQAIPVAATPAPSAACSAPKPIQMSDAINIALRTLAITRLRVSSVISAAKADDGWRVAVELVERAAVPDSGDLLGVYEVQLNHTGEVNGYERTRVRRRNDLR